MADIVIDGKLNPSLFREGQRIEFPKLSTLVSVSGSITYVGKTAMGQINQTSETIWQIIRITETSTDTAIEWADGNEFFDNVWDDRATLNYF